MRRTTRRGLLSVEGAASRNVVEYFAVDNFGEVPGRKREATERARVLGHHLGSWHQRKSDPARRWDAWCLDCNRTATVATERPDGVPVPDWIYGHATTERCGSQ